MTTRPADQPWRCDEVRERLYDYLDLELEPEEKAAVARHVEGCETCRRQFEFEDQFLTRMRLAARTLEAPPRLRDRIAELFGRR